MGASCYVVGCKSGNPKCKEKARFFKPKDLKTVKEWEKFIGRKDRKLNKKHSICHKHFEDADIIREQVLEGKNGNGPIVIDFCRWKLTDGAVPKLLTGKPVVNSKPPRRVLRRTPLSEVTALRGKNKIPEKHNINLKDVALPSSWFWQQGSLKKQELICSKFKWLDENHFEYTKTVIISEDTRTLRYFLRGQHVLHEDLTSQFSTIHELYTYIKLFDDAQVCIGNPGYPGKFFWAKPKCSQSTKQNVQSTSEKNISEGSSNTTTKTSSQQLLATPDFLILQQDNSSKNIDEAENTRTLDDHTNDVATEISTIQLVEIQSENFYNKTLPVAKSVVTRDEYSGSNSPTHIATSPIIPSEDEFTVLPRMIDGPAVSLRYPIEFFRPPTSNSIDFERKLVNRSYRCAKSNYNLVSYLLETWKLGIYTSFESNFTSFMVNQHKVPLTIRQPIVNDWAYFRQPTFLIALPQKVYCRRKAISNDSTALEPTVKVKATLKFSDIENMKSFNGKIHVTLNGESLVKLSLSNLFQDESNYYDYQPIPSNASKRGRSCDLLWDVEPDEDANDLKDFQLAKRLLHKEGRRKKVLLKQLDRLFENYAESKGLARSILKASKKIRLMRPENEVTEEPKPPTVKKPAPLMKCQQCNKMILVSRMKTHLKVHSGVKPHLCELCGRAFVFKSSLNSHIRINHGKEAKPFMCSTCGYTCRRKQILDNHERIHTNERPFECSICDKRFRSKANLVIHKRTHTGEKRYTCNICAKSYTQSKSLKKHLKRHHENAGPNGAKDLHLTGSKISYHCEFCQKQFWRFLTYEKHRATHTGVTVAVRCPQPNCEFTYSDMTELKNHMLKQHPEKAYPCDVCEKVFLAKHTLKDHQALHDPALGYQCSYCPAKLTVKANLIAHEKKHTRDTPFECSYCEMRFFSTHLLHIHTRKHHLPSQPKRKRIRKPSEK